MKRILFIERALSPTFGGVERVSFTLSQAFQEKGFETFFLYSHQDSDLIPADRKQQFDINGNADSLVALFMRFIDEKQIDTVICQNVHQPVFQTVYRKIRQSRNLKFITCFHANPDIWVNKNRWGCTTAKVYFHELVRSLVYWFGNPWKRRIEGMYAISDRYVLLSERFIPVFRRLYKTADDGKKLAAITNPCAFSEESDAGTKENIVLVVARMAEQQKRISNALQVWQRLCRQFDNWRLVIVGGGPDLTLYKTISAKLGLINVEFVGHSNTVADYYKKSKIFLMTSIWEGLGLTVVEAQHYGCVPVAFYTYASLRDIIDDGSNGYIVERHNITEFAQKTAALMTDSAALNTMAANARRSADSKFCIETIIQQWIKLINII